MQIFKSGDYFNKKKVFICLHLIDFFFLNDRFHKISKKGNLSLDNFRDSLGVLGLEHASFLADRIYSIIDSDIDGQVTFIKILLYFSHFALPFICLHS